jgi:hypothetical protein
MTTKEAKAAWDHWFLTRRKLRKAPQEATQEKAQAPGAGKKMVKIVSTGMPLSLSRKNSALC